MHTHMHAHIHTHTKDTWTLAGLSKLKLKVAVAGKATGTSSRMATEGKAWHAPHAAAKEGLEDLVGVHICNSQPRDVSMEATMLTTLTPLPVD